MAVARDHPLGHVEQRFAIDDTTASPRPPPGTTGFGRHARSLSDEQILMAS